MTPTTPFLGRFYREVFRQDAADRRQPAAETRTAEARREADGPAKSVPRWRFLEIDVSV
jgi:hypothetical protein